MDCAFCSANNPGTTGTLQIASSTWVQRNGDFKIGYSAGSVGQLFVTNSLLDVRSNAISIGPANSSGTVMIVDSTVLCSNINPVSYSAGTATMTIGGASFVTNYGTLAYGYFQNPLIANVTMTGGTWWQGGAVTLPSSGSCETGTLTIAGGSFMPQSTVTVGNASTNSAVGILTLSNVVVTLPSSLTLGSTGVVNVVNSVLNVTGTCTLASVAVFPGQSAVLMMTNSAVTNWGTVNVSQNGASVSSIRQIGGSWSVIGSNVNFGSSAGGAASYVVSNGVFQQIGGAFFLGSKTNFNCPAWVELDGTQRQFQVAAFTNYAYGVFSNNIAQVAGGLDITATSSNALSISSTGVVSLVYAQDPVATGNYWGLRWLGTNGFTVLKNYHAAVPPRLTWDDSALSPYYTNQINIFTGSENSVAYTYVGIQVTTVISKNKGTAVYFR